jgi:hypothetical protein
VDDVCVTISPFCDNTTTDTITPPLPDEVSVSFGTPVTTYLDVLTWADWIAETIPIATARLGSETCWSDFLGFRSRMTEFPPTSYSGNGLVLFAKLRFRFRIPNTHLGSKFTITYDIAEFPEDGDPSFVSEDNVVEWTGPGSGLSTDPSWLTDWIEIDPPEVPGERRVVNIRFTCYTGTKFGSKPQVTGEAFEPPAP